MHIFVISRSLTLGPLVIVVKSKNKTGIFASSEDKILSEPEFLPDKVP